MYLELGFSLIECLICLIILSIVLLSIDAMQLNLLHDIKNAYYFSVGNHQLNAMHELLFVYNKHDNLLLHWNKQNADLLPNGYGTIEKINNKLYKTNIFWGAKDNRHCKQNKIGLSGCVYRIIKIDN